MQEPSSIAKSIAIAFVVVAIFWLLRVASSADGRSRRAGFVMEYSWASVTVAGVFSVGAAAGILALFLVPENRSAESLPYVALALALVVAPATWFLCETLRKRLLVNSVALVELSGRRRRKRMKWQSVRSVEHSAILGCYFLVDDRGRRLMISDLIGGQRRFARAVASKVPKEFVACSEHLEALSND